MKKTVTLFISAMLVLALLAGCGSGGAAATPAPTVAPTVEPTVAPTPEPTPEPTEEPADELSQILGYYSEDETVYMNDFADFTFTLPESWVFATDEELANIMGAGSEAVFGEDASAAMEYAQNSTVYSMMAGTVGGESNVMVMFENLARYLGGTKMTEDDYLDALKAGLAQVTAFTYEIGEVTDANYGGYDYRVLNASVPEYGMDQSYCVRRVGDYILCLCVTGSAGLGEGGLGAYIGSIA